jgi:hypothetical protein
MSDGRGIEHYLDGLSEDRRAFVKRILKTTAFAVPVVASFSLDGLTKPARAQTNSSVS